MMPWAETLVRIPARLGISSRVHELELSAGAGGFLGTNEVLPDRFCSELREAFQPSGYLVGAGCGRYAHGIGCGNVLSLLPAFAAPPLGLVLADPDLAVVCGLEMVADGLARHATAEDFVAAVVCGGRAALQESEERVLRRRRERGLDLPGESSRLRLWRGLDELTAGFTRRPAEAPGLAAEWARAEPAAGEPTAVWTHLVRSYSALQDLARSGAFVVVRSSILDPAFIAAVSRLPGFEQGRNLVYLSNIADHEMRRILFASARRKLGLAAVGELELSNSSEFVACLNTELEELRVLSGAPGRAVFVATSETHDLRLAASPEPPGYDAGDFFLQIDLDGLAARLFTPPGPEPGFEGAASALFGAAFRRDRDQAAALLESLVHELDVLPLAAGDRAFVAFRLAALGEAVRLVVERGLAAVAPDRLSRLVEEIRRAADRLLSDFTADLPADPAAVPETPLFAHALAVASAVLGDTRLAGRSESFARAGLPAVAAESAASLGLHAEALFRLLRFTIHRPSDTVSTAVGRGVAALRAAIDATGTLAAKGSPGESPAFSEEKVAWTVRLLLFFHGLQEEALDPVRAALLLRRVA